MVCVTLSSTMLYLIIFNFPLVFKIKYGEDVIIQNGQMYNIQNRKWF